jgi:hypothetical protein
MKIGYQLPNGAKLLAQFEWTDGSGYVLAQTRDAEWATWEYYRRDLKSTSQGHYYDNAEEASDDFFRRIRRMHERVAWSHGQVSL